MVSIFNTKKHFSGMEIFYFNEDGISGSSSYQLDKIEFNK